MIPTKTFRLDPALLNRVRAVKPKNVTLTEIVRRAFIDYADRAESETQCQTNIQ
jgi:hypothetical protein